MSRVYLFAHSIAAYIFSDKKNYRQTRDDINHDEQFAICIKSRETKMKSLNCHLRLMTFEFYKKAQTNIFQLLRFGWKCQC